MRRILILRGGALGDFIVTLPALALLHDRWPSAEIELVGNAIAAELGRTRGLLSAVHSQHSARWATLYGDDALPDAMAAWLAGFDLVVNYWPDPDGELRRRFPLRPDQVFLSATAVPELAPAAAHYCAPLSQLGLATKDYVFPLTQPTSAAIRARGVILVHPGSGSQRKNWSAANWRDFLPRLPEPVSVVLGEAELERWRAQLPTPLGVHSIVTPPLEELVAHCARCRLFIGHDSGISHLAAACGAPSVLLFGPTEPQMWAPPAAHVRAIRHGADLDSISVSDLCREIESALQAGA